MFDCPICFDPKSLDEITTLPCNCKACSDCLSDWVTMKIQEQGRTVDQTIDCIISTCKKTFPIHSVYSNILPSDQQKLDQALLQDYLSKDKNIRKCPKPGCTYAGVIDLSAKCQEDINCQLCGTTWRDKSQLTWSETLRNHLLRMGTSKDESLSYLWKGWKTKKCPNCSVDIQKNQGCAHMTCSRCCHEFCWDCKEQFPKHKIGVHLARVIIPSAICAGLTVLAWRKFCAIPAVQKVAKSFIRPTVNSLKSFLGKAAKGVWRFYLTNLPLLGLAGALRSKRSGSRNGFIMMTSVSLGWFFSMELYRNLFKTLCIDLAMAGGLYLLQREKRRRQAQYYAHHVYPGDDVYQEVPYNIDELGGQIDLLPHPIHGDIDLEYRGLENKMLEDKIDVKSLRRSLSA